LKSVYKKDRKERQEEKGMETLDWAPKRQWIDNKQKGRKGNLTSITPWRGISPLLPGTKNDAGGLGVKSGGSTRARHPEDPHLERKGGPPEFTVAKSQEGR